MIHGSGGGARRRRSVSYTAAIVAFVLGVIAVVLFSSLLIYKAWTEAQTGRDGAIPVITAEFARLPPPDGASASQPKVLTDPGRGPDVEIDYSQVATCSDVQEHYTQLALANGWQSKGTQQFVHQTIDTYSKSASDYNLQLRVACLSDEAASNSSVYYSVDIHG